MKIVYLAGPHQADDYRSNAKALLEDSFLLIDPLRPARDFRGSEDERWEDIVSGDLADINQAHVVLGNFNENSVGTSMECWYAYHTKGIPVIAWVEEGRRVSPWVRRVTRNNVHTTLMEACRAVEEVVG